MHLEADSVFYIIVFPATKNLVGRFFRSTFATESNAKNHEKNLSKTEKEPFNYNCWLLHYAHQQLWCLGGVDIQPEPVADQRGSFTKQFYYC